jgi:hypothetical protein
MDLKVFYRKVRETEAGIAEAYPVVVSEETPDGGRAGVRSEVSREVAARMIVEGRARLATAEEAAEFREQALEAKRQAEAQAAASRVQLTVVSEAELRALKNALRPAKG